MYAFWSSVMLTTGRYKGNPVVKHLVIPGIRPHLFERWLALFDDTCGELFDEGISEQFRVKAARIAEEPEAGLVLSARPSLATGGQRNDVRRHRIAHQIKYMDCVNVCSLDCFYEGESCS